ncbi:hypothetical protein LguiA_005439 [Lonicera macranthoides]
MQVKIEEAENLSVSKGLERGFDVVSEGELRERGFPGIGKTKLVRHKDVIKKIKQLNEEMGVCVSVMIDTKGSQHVVDHGAPTSRKMTKRPPH